jgi:hypothetical protein
MTARKLLEKVLLLAVCTVASACVGGDPEPEPQVNSVTQAEKVLAGHGPRKRDLIDVGYDCSLSGGVDMSQCQSCGTVYPEGQPPRTVCVCFTCVESTGDCGGAWDCTNGIRRVGGTHLPPALDLGVNAATTTP